MVDRDKLKGAIRAKGMTQEELADSMGIKHSTFNARINRTSVDTDFAGELIQKLGLKLEEAHEIFFAKKD